MAVTDEAIARIRDLIKSGGLRPGDRLPPEKELSESLGSVTQLACVRRSRRWR